MSTDQRSPGSGCTPWLCALSLVVLVGCGSADQGPDPYVVRDSVGIQIVESTVPIWGDVPGWEVDAAPTTRIGLSDGDPRYLFSRVAGAVRMANGTIVVGDGISNEIRFFDASGGFVRSVGRTGQGPGEFEYLRGLSRCGGDSLLAFDLSWQTKVYEPGGELVREMRWTEPDRDRPPYRLTCSPGGAFAIAGWGEQTLQRQIGFYAATSPVWILDGEGGVRAELGEFVSSERIGSEGGSRPHPFGRSTLIAGGPDRIYVGPSEGLEILVYGFDGELRAILRGPQPDLEIRATHLARYRQERLDAAPPERRQAIARDVDEMPSAPAFPAYDRMEVDSDGNLWVRRFRKPGEAGPVWVIFDARGVLLGELTTPEGLEVTEIGSDHVLGVHEDELGVERIQLHGLRKPG
jgi:hypothetical protein